MEQVITGFNAVSNALRLMTVKAEIAAAAFKEFSRAWTMVHAAERSGNWPDRFTLFNRYLRTGLEPEYLSDERWEY